MLVRRDPGAVVPGRWRAPRPGQVALVLLAPEALDEVGGLLADHDDWGVGVAADQLRHDGGVHHPEARHSVHPVRRDAAVRRYTPDTVGTYWTDSIRFKTFRPASAKNTDFRTTLSQIQREWSELSVKGTTLVDKPS